MPLNICLTAKIELLTENSHACTGCKLKAGERGFWSFALMTKWTALGTVPLELVGLSKISSCCITLRHTSMHVLRKQNREFQCNWGHYKMLQEISLKKMLQEIHSYLAMVNLWEFLPSKNLKYSRCIHKQIWL